MAKRTSTADRIDKLEASLAALTATMTALVQHVQGTQTTPTAAPTTPAPTTAPTTPAVKVTARRPAPPLPQRPTTPAVKVTPRPAPMGATTAPAATTAPMTGATTPAEAHRASDRCFLGCRTQRGHASRPSTGLIEISTGQYWPKGEGNGTRFDPRPGALNAHAAAGTQWRAVNDATGEASMVNAQAILEALERMRREDGAGNRGAPAVLCGEEALGGWRLAPAPFRRATLAERMASDDSAYQALVALAREATDARRRMGRD